ncbi:microtubule-associated protein futsch isoform X15 [Neodiprion pinetum]|uniref:microtubule-associated protein futsch isoform X15 n=1 Tax=Neodiprion pinetum TaxID=441929 RepID=UPI001EDFA8EC|nr:microtubule-associated protein futsch-like isoform X15 [Neodiprion pinetum]
MPLEKVKHRKKPKKMACCGCARNRNSDLMCEDPMLSDQQQYRYMTVDDMKSMGDDSMRLNVTDDERDNRHSGAPTITEMITKESYHRSNAANHKPDNVDINRHPIHVGASIVSLNTSLAALGIVPKGQGMWRDSFLVSFLVDARGGAMRGCRHSGVRVIVPPRKAAMPMRVTCRYLKRDKLTNPPPLMEGEALASRILELGPVGAKFLGPVIIEVPHFASLRGKEREIVILRSDNGETWREHTLEASEEAVQDVLNESFEGEELSQLEDLQTSRIVRILTVDFPHYFAVVSRVRQEVHAVGPEGGTVSSSAVPQVQAVFPPAALTKKIRVGLQAHPIPSDLVAKLLGNRVAVSPIVTVEPRRRKFHKPITLTIPMPQAANKGMINQYSGDAGAVGTLRLLCSITGGQSRAVWEDVTGSTPLTFVKDCVSFTTTVSARFWLMDCRNISEATKMATELYTHATHVPFMAKFVVFAKRVDPLEARLRVFCMTDDKEDKTLEHQEHFTEVAKSRDVEVLEGKTQYMEFAGNLIPVLKSGEQLQLPFRAFKENRVPFTARVKDPDAADTVGRIMFMSEPKVPKGEPSQTPLCTLNILLPEKISPEGATSELDLLELSKNYSFLRDGGITRPDAIHRATIRLTDIANLLDKDWEKLAEELNIPPNDVQLIKQEYPGKPAQQADMMFKLWQSDGNKATGNTLEKALNKIGRKDIVKRCIFNVELVTDDVEKAVARVRLDQPGFDSLKEELGPSRDTSLRRDATMDPKMDPDWEEPDRMKESESVEDLSIPGAVTHKRTTEEHRTVTNGTIPNGTSTPIKDKYASDEKEFGDMMADFVEYKCHISDTMTKRSKDDADDDNIKRQRVIEDANKIVSGVIQDAERKKERLAEGWSVVNDDDDAQESKEAAGAVGPHLILSDKITTVTEKDPKLGQTTTVHTFSQKDVEPAITKQYHVSGPSIDFDNSDLPLSTKHITVKQKDPINLGQNITVKTTTITDYTLPVTRESQIVREPQTRETYYFGPSDPVIGSGASVTTTDPKESVSIVTSETRYIGQPTTDIITTITAQSPNIPEVILDTESSCFSEKPIDEHIQKGKVVISGVVKEIEFRSDKVGKDVKDLSGDLKTESDLSKGPVKSVAKIYDDANAMLSDVNKDIGSEKEKLASEGKEIDEKLGIAVDQASQELKQKPKEIKGILKIDSTKIDVKETVSAAKPQEDPRVSAYEIIYNVQQDAEDNKDKAEKESKKLKDKSSGIFSGIFKTPKSKKLKSKDSKDVSFDSGDEDAKNSTLKFLEDTRKTADSAHQPDRASSPVYQPSAPLDDQKSNPLRNIKVSTAEFLDDTRRTAEVFQGLPKEPTKTTTNILSTGGTTVIVTENFQGSQKDNNSLVSPDLNKDKDIVDPDRDVTIHKAQTLKDKTKPIHSIPTDPKQNSQDVNIAIVAKDKLIDSTKSSGGSTSIEKSLEDAGKTTKVIRESVQYVTDEKINSKDTPTTIQKVSDNTKDLKEESKDKGSGFFGIFKSPKSKSKKRSKSKDKGSSKETSFDSGDEELRITTAKFLDDTKKVADQRRDSAGQKITSPQDIIDIKKDRFVDNVHYEFDTPTDKIKGTFYDVKAAAEKAEADVQKTISDGALNVANKTSEGLASTTAGIVVAVGSIPAASQDLKSDITTVGESSRQAGGEIINVVEKDVKIIGEAVPTKIPDITDQMTATGQDIKKTTDTISDSFKEGSKNLHEGTKNFQEKVSMEVQRDVKVITEPAITGEKKLTTKAEALSQELGTEVKDASDEVKEKSGGFFGIFKSPKSKSKKRGKSKDKDSSKETSFDSGDEELRIATEKFLHDTRKAADDISFPVLRSSTHDELANGNKPVVESSYDQKKPEGTKTTGKDAKNLKGDIEVSKVNKDAKVVTEKDTKEVKEPKEKSAGFLPGILKDAKHAIDEVTEDVKEFWHESKKEAAEEEEKAKQPHHKDDSLQKSQKVVSTTTTQVTEMIQGGQDDASKHDIRPKSEIPVPMTAATHPELGIRIIERKTEHTYKKDAPGIKEGSNSDKKIISQEPTSDEQTLLTKSVISETVPTNGKANVAGDKSVGSDDDSTKEKGGGFFGIFKSPKSKNKKRTKSKDKQSSRETSIDSADEDLRLATASFLADLKNVAVTRDVGLPSVEDTESKTKQGELPVVGDLKYATTQFLDESRKGSATVDIGVSIGDVKQPKLPSPSKKESPSPSDTMYNASIVHTGNASKDDPNLHEKGSDGFLSGILTGTKQTIDEVTDDVTGFFKGPPKQVKEAEHSAASVAQKTSDKLEDAKTNIVSDAKVLGAQLSEAIDRDAAALKKTSESIKDTAQHKLATDYGVVSDATRDATTKVSQEAKKIADGVEDDAKKMVETSNTVKDEISHKTKQEVNILKDKVSSTEDAITDVIGETSEKATKKSKKIKHKGSRFLSGIFKGTKQAVDEVKDDAAELAEQTKKAAEEVGQDAKHVAQGTAEKLKNVKDDIVDSTKNAKDKLAQEISDDSQKLLNASNRAKDNTKEKLATGVEIVSDAAQKVSEGTKDLAQAAKGGTESIVEKSKETKDKVSEEIINDAKIVKDKLRSAADSVADTAGAAKDKTTKEAKKVKEKTSGFLSGIFKGTKHSIDEVKGDAVDFLEETKKEEEKARRAAQEASEKMKAEIIDDTKGALAQISHEISEDSKKLIDASKSTKDKTTEKLAGEVDSVSKAAKNAATKVSEGSAGLIGKAKDGTEVIVTKSHDVKDKISKEIKDNATTVKDEVVAAGGAMASAAEATKEKTAKEEKKAKEKSGGFLSGIFKSAKHAADEVKEDIEEFLEDTKKEANEEEERAKHAAQETSTKVRVVKDKIVDDAKDIKAKLVEKVTDGSKKLVDTSQNVMDKTKEELTSGVELVADTTKSTADKISNEATELVGKAKQGASTITDKSKDIKDKAGLEIRGDVKVVKDKLYTMADTVADTATSAKEKTTKEAKKAKEKTGGFFSGIFKGAKEAVDDVKEDIEEFLDDTKKEAKEEEDRARRAAKETGDKVDSVKDKIKDNTENVKTKISTEVSEDSQRLLDASKDAKYKTEDKFTTGIEVVADTAKVAADTVSKKTSEIADEAKDSAQSIAEKSKDAKDKVSKEITDDVVIAKEKLASAADGVVDTVAFAKDKTVDETKKAKEKTSGFLSGIFKGAKHAVDEIKDDVGEFLEDTKKEAELEADRAKCTAHETSENVKDVKDKVVDMAKDTTAKLSQEIAEDSRKLFDASKNAKDKAEEKLVTGVEVMSDTTKTAADTVSKGTSDLLGRAKGSTQTIVETSKDVKNNVKQEIKDDAKIVKDKLASAADATAETADAAIDKTTSEVKKAKEKTTGFFSGIFKGAKHAADEAKEDVGDFLEETRKEAESEAERAQRIAHESSKKIKDAKGKVVDSAKDVTSKLSQEIVEDSKKLSDASKNVKDETKQKLSTGVEVVADATKATAGKVSKETTELVGKVKDGTQSVVDKSKDIKDKVEKEIKDDITVAKDTLALAADTIADSASSAKDKTTEGAKKAKEKSGGFLSGIFKGAKHAVEEVKDDFEEFLDDTKKEAESDAEHAKHAAHQMSENVKDIKSKVLGTTKDAAAKASQEIAEDSKKLQDVSRVVKDKTKEKFTTGVEFVSDTTKAATDKVAEETSGLVVKAKDGTQTVVEKSKDIKDKVSKEIKDDTKVVKDKLASAADAVVDTAESAAEKTTKGAKKTKEKGSRFFSGIFKGAKHSVDDVKGDAGDFLEEAKREEERARRAAQDTFDKVRDTKDATVSRVTDVKNETSKGIIEGSEKLSNVSKSVEDKAKDKFTTGIKVVSDTAKATADKVSVQTSEIVGKVEDSAQSAAEKSKDIKDQVSQQIKDDVELAKNKLASATDTVADSAVSAKDKTVLEAKKAKEKTGGFLSGIFKGAKHTVNEAKEEVGEFIGDNKKQAESEVERAKHAASKTSENVKEVKDKVVDTTKNAATKLSQEISEDSKKLLDVSKGLKDKTEGKVSTGVGIVSDATKATVDKLSKDTSDLVEKAKDGTQSIIDKSKDVQGKVEKEIKDDITIAKDKLVSTADSVADTASSAKDKTTEEAKKVKDKTGGFLSGIFKGAKHAVDEIKDDFEEFLDDTKKEAESEAEHGKQAAHQTSEKIKEVQDKVVNTTKDAAAKVSQEIAEDSKKLSEASKNIKDKAKVKFTTGIETVSDTTKAAADKAAKETAEFIGKTKEDTKSVIEKSRETKDHIGKEIKDDVAVAKDKLTSAASTVADTAASAKDKTVQEAKNAKEATGGFLSGIFKGAKHAIDEIKDDVEEFFDDTKKEAEAEAERAKKTVQVTSENIKDVKDKIVDETKDATAKLSQEISEDSKKLADASKHAADKTKDKFATGVESLSDATKSTADKISKETSDFVAKAKDGSQLIAEKSKDFKDKVGKEIEDDAKTVKDKLVSVADATVDTADTAIDKTAAEVKKAKEKTGGFLSGIFKGAKHSVDEVKLDAGDFLEETKREEERARYAAQEVARKVEGNKSEIIDSTKDATHQLSQKVAKDSKKVLDASKSAKDKTKEEIAAGYEVVSDSTKEASDKVAQGVTEFITTAHKSKDQLSKEIKDDAKIVKDKLSSTAVAVASTVESAKDKTAKESKKAKEKGSGFFSGIFKGTKHAVSEAKEDVEEFFDGKKKDLKEDEERAKQAAQDTIKEVQGKVADTAKTVNATISQEIAEDSKKLSDASKSAKDNITEKLDSAIDVVSDATNVTAEKVSKEATEFTGKITDGTKTIVEKSKDVKAQLGKEVDDDVRVAKEKLTSAGDAVADTAEAVIDKTAKEAKKAKEKSSGFLSGIFKTTKHAVDEVKGDAADFLEETKKEEEQARRAAQEAAEQVKHTTDEILDGVETVKNKTKSKLGAGVDLVSDTTKDTVDSASAKATNLLDKAQDSGAKIIEKSKETKEKLKEEINRDAKVVGDTLVSTADAVTDTVETAKAKTAKEAKKAKEKGSGFLSGIFKGTKHTVDDVKGDIEEFVDDTKKEAKEEEERARRAVQDTSKEIKDVKDKVLDGTKEVKAKLSREVTEDSQKIIDIAKSAKDKTKEKLTTGVEVLSDTTKSAADKVADEASKVAVKAKDGTKSIVEKSKDVKDKVDKEIRHDVEVGKEKLSSAASTVADTATSAKDKTAEEVKKAKEKTGGFLSGIFKGVKHAVDDVKEDVEEFLDDTKQEAESETERAKHAADRTSETVKDAKDKVVDLTKDATSKLSQEISEDSKKISDASKKAKDKTKKKLTTGVEAISDAATGAVEKISQESSKLAGKATDGTRSIVEKSQGIKDEVEKEIKHDIVVGKEKVSSIADSVADSATSAGEKTAQEAKKAKEKTGGFFSGIFQGAKHVVDEIKDDVEEFVEETKSEAEKEAEHTKQAGLKTFEDIKDAKSKLSQEIAEDSKKLSDTSKSAQDKTKKTLATGVEAVSDTAKAAGDKVSKGTSQLIGKAKHGTQSAVEKSKDIKNKVGKEIKEDVSIAKVKLASAADSVAESATSAKDKTAQEAKKAKEKTGGFFSGIFQGAKHVVDEIKDDVEEFLDDTKTEAEEETERAKQAALKTSENIEDAKANVVDTSKDVKAKLSQEITEDSKKLSEASDSAKDKTKKTIVAAVEGVSDTAKAAGDKVSKGTSELIGKAKDSAQSAVEKSKDITDNVGKEIKDDVAIAKDKLTSAADSVGETATAAKDKTAQTAKKAKEETGGFLTGIIKGAKHMVDEAKEEVEEFLDETKKEAEEETKRAKLAAQEASKNIEHTKDSVASSAQDATAKLTSEVAEDSQKLSNAAKSAKEKTKGKLMSGIEAVSDTANATADKVAQGAKEVTGKAKQGTEAALKKSKQVTDAVGKEIKDGATVIKDETSSAIADVVQTAEASTEKVSKAAKKGKEKGSKLFSGIFKGSKHDTVNIPDKKASTAEKQKITQADVSNAPESISDAKLATMMFLADTRSAAEQRNEPYAFGNAQDYSDSASSSARSSLDRDASLDEDKKSKKRKGVISSIVKGAKSATHKIAKEVDHAAVGLKDATEKFWEDTKRESDDSLASGSYNVSSAPHGSDRIENEEAVASKSFVEKSKQVDRLGDDDTKKSFSEGKGKLISRIPQKVSPTKELKHTPVDSSDRLVAGVTSRLEHLEPRTRQSVTTVVTKSVRTAATPPPSPAEFSDSSIKDVTEEASRRAQDLADQSLSLTRPGHDSTEIDGTVERHATSAPSKQPVPAPRHSSKLSTKTDLHLQIEDTQATQTPKSPKTKIPEPMSKLPQKSPETSKVSLKSPKRSQEKGRSPIMEEISASTFREPQSPKSKIPVKIKETTKDGNKTIIKEFTTDDGMTTVTETVSAKFVESKLPGLKSSSQDNKFSPKVGLPNEGKTVTETYTTVKTTKNDSTESMLINEDNTANMITTVKSTLGESIDPQKFKEKFEHISDLEPSSSCEQYDEIQEDGTIVKTFITRSTHSGDINPSDLAELIKDGESVKTLKTIRTSSEEQIDPKAFKGMTDGGASRRTVTTITRRIVTSGGDDVTEGDSSTEVMSPAEFDNIVKSSGLRNTVTTLHSTSGTKIDPSKFQEKLSLEDFEELSKKGEFTKTLESLKTETGEPIDPKLYKQLLKDGKGLVRTVTTVKSTTGEPVDLQKLDFKDGKSTKTVVVKSSLEETIDPEKFNEFFKDGNITSAKTVKETIRTVKSSSSEPETWTETVVTKRSSDGKPETWQTIVRSGDVRPEDWETEFSLDTSPGSGNGDFYSKNGSSRREVNSESDSDSSPQPRRRSPSKRRTLGSSSGSDVALHEGAELSPLEDDQGTSLTANLLTVRSSVQSACSTSESSLIGTKPRTRTSGRASCVCWMGVAAAVLVALLALILVLEPRTLRRALALSSHAPRQAGV